MATTSISSTTAAWRKESGTATDAVHEKSGDFEEPPSDSYPSEPPKVESTTGAAETPVSPLQGPPPRPRPTPTFNGNGG